MKHDCFLFSSSIINRPSSVSDSFVICLPFSDKYPPAPYLALYIYSSFGEQSFKSKRNKSSFFFLILLNIDRELRIAFKLTVMETILILYSPKGVLAFP